MRINIIWGSHLPVLIKLVGETTGDILELGTGLFSTPFLHWSCFNKKRKLVSYEGAGEYIKLLEPYKNDFHDVHAVEDWDSIDIEKKWDIAFVDHAPDIRRGIEAGRFANHAKYVILHDSAPHNDKYYHYDKIYPLFKYRFDYKKTIPNTTVLSNFVDLTNFKI